MPSLNRFLTEGQGNTPMARRHPRVRIASFLVAAALVAALAIGALAATRGDGDLVPAFDNDLPKGQLVYPTP